MTEVGVESTTNNITSPRNLQEMSLPVQEGHDVTSASGVSLKQYEEQLNGLRKENFHLKLRVYFLEEKLGSGAPPAIQGLLEHNVRLQVEVQELRRQLTDKQELLAAAAEAIDVLEQQGSISTDSVEASINISTTLKEDNICHVRNQDLLQDDQTEQTGDETCGQETEVVEENLGISIHNSEMEELLRLRRENKKALQMIKGCFKKIQQQEKEIKKHTMNKVVDKGQDNKSIEKYEEILQCKNDYIRDLEHKVKELQRNISRGHTEDTAGNLEELLTRRLQGLAYFLDKLLSNKCVLGEEKKKLAESILEQSLALPVGLKLDESVAPEDFTMDDSNLDLSHSLRLEDLTMMFGHHMSCGDGVKCSLKKYSKQPQADILSESECWSEPDRNVSLARIGLDTAVGSKDSTSDGNKHRLRRSRVSYGSRAEDTKPVNDSLFLGEISQLNQRIECLEGVEKKLLSELNIAKEQIEELITERNDIKTLLYSERSKLLEITTSSETWKQMLSTMESKVIEFEQQLVRANDVQEKLHKEKQDLEATFLETERSLKRAADEATLQASQSALERARAQHERLRVERELEEIRDKLSCALDANSQLQLEISNRIGLEVNNKMAVLELPLSEEDRPTSPDQGIDSDRLSSLEHNDALARSPRSLYEENIALKQKLARTKVTLADTLTQLNAANMRKRSVQRAICREIHKTHGVLRKARDQLENQNDDCKIIKEI